MSTGSRGTAGVAGGSTGAADDPPSKRRPGENALKPNDVCFCGSGKKFKKCCRAGLVGKQVLAPAAAGGGKNKNAAKAGRSAKAAAAAAGDAPRRDDVEPTTLASRIGNLSRLEMLLWMAFLVSSSLKLIHYLADFDTRPMGRGVQIMLAAHPAVWFVPVVVFGIKLIWPTWRADGLATQACVFVGLTAITYYFPLTANR